MIDIRKGYVLCKEHNISYSKDLCCKECEKMNCLLCNQNVNKHYFSKKHIDNFDKNITIKTRNSIKKKLILNLIFI